MPVDFRPRGSGCARRHSGSQANQRTGEGQGTHYHFVNFVFIVIVSFCLIFYFFGLLWLLVIEESVLAVHRCTA